MEEREEREFWQICDRGYNQRKIQENIECEIMQVVLETARESYAQEIVIELPSNTVEDMESNVDRVRQWLEAWKAQNGKQ